MSKFLIFLLLIFLTIIGLFAMENKDTVILKVPFGAAYEMPKIGLMLLSLSFGAFFIFIVFLLETPPILSVNFNCKKGRNKKKR